MQWTAGKKTLNQQIMTKLIQKINWCDKKEELTDLTLSEMTSRIILTDELNEIYDKVQLFQSQCL